MPHDWQQLHIILVLDPIATCMGVACSMYKEQVNTERYGGDCRFLNAPVTNINMIFTCLA